MSKKLLNEGTIRQFMKLANIGPLTDAFVNERYGNYNRDDELEGAPAEEEELGGGEVAGLEPGEPTDELPEEPVGTESEELLKRVVRAVADELGVDVEVEGEEAEADLEAELEPDLGPAPEAEEEVVAEAEEEVTESEEEVVAEDDDLIEAVESLLEKAGIEVVDDKKVNEDVIKKVSGRVARRLLKELL